MATDAQGLGPGIRTGAGRTRRALAAGAAGVAVLTGLNEAARRVWDRAPRVERLGARAVGRIARRAGVSLDREERFWLALAGAALADGAYFALAGLPRRRNRGTGLLLGAVAGAGALLLPGPLGLGERPTRRTSETTWATLGWYLAAGLAAGVVARRMRPPEPAWTF
ncbi:MAG TPA: hypothetical protein VFL83_03385 [Anaeromyxobacter sp.]|nr:hypothetical protein [Anaeromyxobacter sp.]